MGHSANSPGRSSDRGYRERSRPTVPGAIPPDGTGSGSDRARNHPTGGLKYGPRNAFKIDCAL